FGTRHARHAQGHANSWRVRREPGISGRAHVPRRSHHGDLRGNQRNPAPGDCRVGVERSLKTRVESRQLRVESPTLPARNRVSFSLKTLNCKLSPPAELHFP